MRGTGLRTTSRCSSDVRGRDRGKARRRRGGAAAAAGAGRAAGEGCRRSVVGIDAAAGGQGEFELMHWIYSKKYIRGARLEKQQVVTREFRWQKTLENVRGTKVFIQNSVECPFKPAGLRTGNDGNFTEQGASESTWKPRLSGCAQVLT
jgi:hypothetical protein